MSLRTTTNLSLKDRKLYTFENFKGVDFSTSPYLVSKNRAISSKNLIYENGTVRKRFGWKSLCKLPSRINGLFSFEIENEIITLAYAEKTFYRLNYNKELNRFSYKDITSSSNIDKDKLEDRRIQLYVNNNKAYIVGCGDYLVYGKWNNGNFELRRVYNNEDTYIPTTTINIDNDTVNDENKDVLDDVNDKNKDVLDDVNILTNFRKNELVGVDEDSATWTLDTAIKDVVEYPINFNSDVIIELYTLDSENQSVSHIIKNNNNTDKTLLYYEDNSSQHIGSVDFKEGKITLNINTKPQEEGTSNIIVTFQHGNDTQAEIINKATISTIFGGSGNSNRLFLSGNSKFKNRHIWSEMYDFTYFSDKNYDDIGSDSSAIVGYVRATDGVLLTFKEKNGSDSTIYYVTATDEKFTDIKNNVKFQTTIYKSAGNISDTIYAKYATQSLNGDNLILTRNGVKGLELYENQSTSAYRLQERSRNVNAKLLKENNLNDACAFVYKDKYYLSINGVVYVCDSRFTFSSEEDISNSFNYEWWYFTNVDARVWCEIDNELYFGTNDGLICKFDNKDYADTTFYDTEEGDLGLPNLESKISYNREIISSLGENFNIKITSGDFYSLYLSSNEMLSLNEEGYIQVDEITFKKLYEGAKFYVDNIEDTGLILNKEYQIDNIDYDNMKFTIADEEKVKIKPLSLGFRMCKKITNEKLYITNVNSEESTFQVKEFPDTEALTIVKYNGVIPNDIFATIEYKQNVVAEWYSPICDLGTNMYSKTLFNMSVVTEPLMKGSVKVGYQTRNLENEFTTYGAGGFDFNDIDFEDFSFENSFTNSNTVKIKERNFNFIIIRYISDNQRACAVNGITIRYKINNLNKGVK